MRAAATVIAVALLATATSAVSLDVEPVETPATELPTTASSTSNNNSSLSAPHKSGIEASWAECSAMKSRNWGDFKYACSWRHEHLFGRTYNFFFKRKDGFVVVECGCGNSLSTYGPWSSSWTYSVASDYVACYSRDGKRVDQVRHEFDAFHC